MADQSFLEYLSQFISQERRELFDRVIQNRTDHVVVVLEDIFQPHNASAVLRSCDLLGIQQVHTIESRNEYNPNPDVALGSNQWLDLSSYDNTESCIQQIKQKGFKIVATSPHSEAYSPDNIPIDEPMALFFGTEKAGLTDEVLNQADFHLKIPMYGFTESFNISVSAAICLYNISQRLRASDLSWQLSPERKLEIMLKWAKQSVKHPEIHEREFYKNQES